MDSVKTEKEPLQPLTAEEVKEFNVKGWPEVMDWAQASAAVATGHGVRGLQIPYPNVFGVLDELSNNIDLMISYHDKTTTMNAQPALIKYSLSNRTWTLDDTWLANFIRNHSRTMNEPTPKSEFVVDPDEGEQGIFDVVVPGSEDAPLLDPTE